MSLTEDEFNQVRRLYGAARDQWEQAVTDDGERNYWQGQKDMSRKILALLAPDEQTASVWETLQDSSPGGYASYLEILQAQVNDAYDTFRTQRSKEARAFLEWVEHKGTYTGKMVP